MRIFTGAALLALVHLISPFHAGAAGSAPQPTICERACWGARPPQGAISQMDTLNRAIVHHTANQGDYNTTSLEDSKANVRATQNYHMDVNGWSDIGYHFLCDKLGYTFEGRDGSMTKLPRGAHDGSNTSSFGFNIMGYYHTPYNNQPTQAGMDALAAVIAWRMPTGWGGPYGYPNCTYGSLGNCVGYVDSHRRVKATACPGDLVHNNYIGDDPAVGTLRDMIKLQMDGGSCAKTVPLVPGSLAAEAISATQVNLTWADNSADEDGFKVYRSTTTGGPYTHVGSSGANTTSFSDGTVASSTTYYYVITSYNCAGESAQSNEATVTTPVSYDIIIDNPSATVTGSWSTGTSASDKYGSDYRFKSDGGGSSWLQFTPDVPELTDYKVYEWHSQGTNRTSGARIEITHSAGTSVVSINQQANGGKWNLLGQYTFNAGTTGYARITDGHTDAGQVVMADAIKFEKVAAAEPPAAVHVHSITMSWVKQGKKYKSQAVVNIKDASGANVSGATVTGDFSGAISETGVSATTDSAGNATITSSGSIASGTVTFTVTNVTGTNMTYDSSANVVTSASATR